MQNVNTNRSGHILGFPLTDTQVFHTVWGKEKPTQKDLSCSDKINKQTTGKTIIMIIIT